MIYLVSNRLNYSTDTIQMMSIEDSISTIKEWPVVQFDTETTGLDPHISTLTSLQFGYHDMKNNIVTSIIVDAKSVDPCLYKEVLEHSYLIGHNLKFDLQFLFNYGIVPRNIYDTMICEQVFYIGYGKKHLKGLKMNLEAVIERHLAVKIDKSFQDVIALSGLTLRGIQYAANDVVYLQEVRKSQIELAKSRKCLNALTVENRAVPAVAYLEWCGIKLDEDKWRKKMAKNIAERDSCLKALTDYVLSNPKLKVFAHKTSTKSLFNDTEEVSIGINWDSSQQVIPILKALGFNTKAVDKKTKKEKETALEKVIAEQKGIADDFLKIYFGYKGAMKQISSYGQNMLNLINPNTGRLHTVFKQIGTTTGRMSSGSSVKNKELAYLKHLSAEKVPYCNLQNLPARGEEGVEARACFIAEEGNTFVSCDYSAEESRVQADVWNEKKLLDAFEHGIDTHNLYAKMCFPEELKNIDVRDVKKMRPDLRQAAKSAEFAVGYGSDGTSFASLVGSVEAARAMVTNILKGMKGMSKFKENAVKSLTKQGYLVINKKTGHRVTWPEWGRWKAEEREYTPAFWRNYSEFHKGVPNDPVVEKVKRHQKLCNDWFNKNVLNYPIQGGCAVVLKQAVADLFDWVVNNGYFGKVLFCAFVHDEIDCECPKEMAESFSKTLQSIMEKAAAKYYHRLPIPADASIGDHWIH